VIIALVAIWSCDWSRPTRPVFDAAVECGESIGSRLIAIDYSCQAQHCAIAASEAACALELTLSSCEDARVSAAIGPEGELSFRTSNELGDCRATEPARDALFSFACGECRGDVYPNDEVIDAEVEAVRIEAVPFEAPEATGVIPLDRREPLNGYLADIAAIENEVAVLSFDGSYESVRCNNERSRIVFVDRATLSVRTSTAPDCLTRIATRRTMPELIGVFGGETPVIGRFEQSGRLIASAPIALPPETMRPYAIAIAIGEDDTARVTLTSAGDDAFTHVATIELTTLSQRVLSRKLEDNVRSAIELPRDLTAASSVEEGAIHVIDQLGASETTIPLGGGDRRFSTDAGALFFHLASGRLIAGATGHIPALYVLDPSSANPLLGDALVYQAFAAPWAMATWPKDQSLVAIGTTEGFGTFNAVIVLFDPLDLHVSPPRLTIGRGVVAELLPDPEGRLWALLPWSAELVRITLR
jgi:hypothetical protein